MSPKYTCYGHDLSYFTRKLEAALIFYGADFDNVAVQLSGVTEDARKRAGTHIIPVLETPERWALWDTTPMLFLLDSRFPDRKMMGDGLDGLLVHLIENFLDEWLGRTMVHYRWHYDECAAIAAPALGLNDEAVAKGIAAWGLKACRATGVESPHQQAMAEAEYARILTAAETQLGKTAYLMGDAPTAVDAVILGGLRAHTMVDPVPRRLVEQYPKVWNWAESGADNWNGFGHTAVFDNPTRFALAMLDEMQTAFVPFILGNKDAVARGDKLFERTVFNEDVTYLTRPYPEKARQMVEAHIARLKSEGIEAAGVLKNWKLDTVYGT